MGDEYYWEAVNRNIGLVSRDEQEVLRGSRIAIAGCGAVGGSYALTLTRMGIGHLNLADFDEYSIANINRQVGAMSSTVGKSKAEVMAAMSKDIHPDVQIDIWKEGLQPGNAEDFLSDADVVVDAIDFFSIGSRLLLYRTARKLGKTVMISAPLGFSGSLHVFTPESMTFERYFDISDDMSTFDKLVAFAVGLTPAATQRSYMDMSQVDLANRAGPSISSAISMCASLLSTEVLTVLLARRTPLRAPQYLQFDPYNRKYRCGRLVWGNRGPLQRLKRLLVSRQFAQYRDLLEADE